MKSHGVNASKNFIAAWYMQPDICDLLIEYYEQSDDKRLGIVGSGVNKEVKDSTDVIVKDQRLAEIYHDKLKEIAHAYIKEYPWCNEYSPWGVSEDMSIQHYRPGQGFKGWHTERSVIEWPYSARHLVFMTYLNDVTDGGETEWFHQNLKIKPEKGLTVIWPADWMFTHRGVVSHTQEKYILTGWFHFLPKTNEMYSIDTKTLADSV